MNRGSLLGRMDQSIQKWFGHMERIDEGKLTKRMHMWKWMGPEEGVDIKNGMEE